MKTFLLSFLTIYGLAHYYFFRSVCKAQYLSRLAQRAFAIVLFFLTIAPLVTRVLERGGFPEIARTVAYPAYCWMGFLFLFISAAVCLELLRLLYWLGSRVFWLPDWLALTPRRFLLISCLYSLCASCVGWFSAAHPHVTQITLTTVKLPPGTPPLRVVQISDLHIGLIVSEHRVQQVVEQIKQLKPDLLVSTGDLVDGYQHHFDGESELFRQLSPPLGMYAIYGNHEHYVGAGQSRVFMERSGFTVLQNQWVTHGAHLALAGVDDPAGHQNLADADESRLLATIPHDRFVLLLKHRPLIGNSSRFDLQLSGHVHGGQIAPFNLLTKIRFPLPSGLNHLTNNRFLYLSRGTGTWGPPIRFLAPPEITVIDLAPGVGNNNLK